MIGALKIKISLNELVNDRTPGPAIQGFVQSIPNSDRTLSIDRPLFAALKCRFWEWTVFFHAIFLRIYFTTTSAVCICFVQIYFFASYAATTEVPRKELSFYQFSTVEIRLISFDLRLISCFHGSVAQEINYVISCFQIGFYLCLSLLFLPFSQMLAIIVKEWRFCCIWFQFVNQSQ